MEVSLQEYVRLTDGDPDSAEEIELHSMSESVPDLEINRQPSTTVQNTKPWRPLCSPFVPRRVLVAGLVLVLVAASVVGYIVLNASRNHAGSLVEPESTGPSASFIVVGDTGTGDTNQYAVAKALVSVCQTRKCEFALLPGDVIYEDGINGANDEQMQRKFEKPYEQLKFPFYAIAGNHDVTLEDHGDGANLAKGSNLVAYAKSGLSTKFVMPDRYYSFSIPEGDPSPLIDFVALETNTLVWKEKDKTFDFEKFNDRQKEVVQERLASSKGTWRIVFGHHPYLSNGKHGSAGMFHDSDDPEEERHPYKSGMLFKRWFEETVCGKADIYFAGHDHSLQWLLPVDTCPKTHHIVSGAGGKTSELGKKKRIGPYKPYNWQVGDTLGFWWVQVTRERMTLTVFTVDAVSGEAREQYTNHVDRQ